MSTATTLPMAPGALPALGHAFQLARDPLGFVSSLPAHGNLVRVRLGPERVVFVSDPDLTRTVLLDDRTFDKGGPLFDRVREVTGDSIVTARHDQHRRQRKLCQPSFHTSRFTRYAELMTDLADSTIRSWRDGQIIEMTNEIAALSVRIALKVMFQASSTALDIDAMGTDFAIITGGIFQRTVMPGWLNRIPTPGNMRYRQAQQRLRTTTSAVVARRRRVHADHGDLLSSLMAAHDPNSPLAGTVLTDEEIVNNAVTFVIAGSETVTSTVLWALHLLARHADIGREVRNEVETVLGGQPPTLEHLLKLDLTSRVITETLRMHTPTWMFTREVTSDTSLDGASLPAGTAIVVSPHLIHHRQDLYPQPHRFDPDRWLGLRSEPRNYLPFGAGGRKCIGDRFALTQIHIVLMTILARWNVTPSDDIFRRRLAINQLPLPHGQHMRVASRR